MDVELVLALAFQQLRKHQFLNLVRDLPDNRRWPRLRGWCRLGRLSSRMRRHQLAHNLGQLATGVPEPTQSKMLTVGSAGSLR